MGPGARHITKSSKDVGVVRCVGDIGQDWVGLGMGRCRSRRVGNFIIRIKGWLKCYMSFPPPNG